ncbi:MAG: type IX secretion system membrane protein PorP/SprF [Bacteroidia bacterium]|nr:type IX secretion system membrane protein PorP/SprF [Bacteroidia bacterium]
MKKYLIIFIFYSLLSCMVAQQLPQISLRMNHNLAFNPAVATAKDNSELSLHHRSQWLGFEGAPITQILSYCGKFQENMGVGGYFINDITGPTRRFSINSVYAYQIMFNDVKLSFGIAASLLQYGIDGRKISLHIDTDNAIKEDVSDKKWKFDASFGSYLYNENFYIGIAVLQLLNSKVRFNDNGLNAKIPLVNHFYFTSGYNLALDEEFLITPSVMYSTTIGSPSQIDFNIKVEYLKKVFGGLSYRYEDAVVLLTGIKLKQQLTVAYSYDILTSRLSAYSSGSHEIFLSFIILNQKKSELLY